MSEDDRSKRQKSQSEKRKKLINPLFFVSAHRLSVRNLAKEVSDNDLKTLCINALKAGTCCTYCNVLYVLNVLYLHIRIYDVILSACILFMSQESNELLLS